MGFNVFGLFFITVLHITIRRASADYCGTVSCDVGKTFLHNTYCCTTSSGALDCCKTFRWEPITFTVLGCVAAVIIVFVICCCCCGCCGCLRELCCCCCKKN
ncbi:hypothetical protein CRM22_001545 [Opisthorchis felineus]|uniref:Cysteine and tyrosine-rich protein 1 n=1 Tax=Opisthorchis felineus TaxID=147828 RepID=A0A4S2MAB5_OPIFE|nr:hypothetical protein CRM22_001545 [Opisthorchis felineus]